MASKDRSYTSTVNVNPCAYEHNLSIKCLEKNNYNQDACEIFYENYSNCIMFWKKVEKEREIPVTAAERDKVLQEYPELLEKIKEQ